MAPAAIVAAGAGASVAILAGLPLLACAALGGVAYGIVVALETAAPAQAAQGHRPEGAVAAVGRTCTPRCRPAAASRKSCARRAQRTDPRPPGRDRHTYRRRGAGVLAGRAPRRRARRRREVAQPQGSLVPARPDPRLATRFTRRRRVLRPHGRGAGGAARVGPAARPGRGRTPRQRLEVLDARMDEAVARAVELSLSAGDAAELSGLGADVDQLVDDMEALRQGLEEVGQRDSAGPAA